MSIQSLSIQQLDQEQAAQHKLKSDILLSENVKYNNDFFKHPSRLDAFAVFFCVSGEAEILINLKKYTLRSGTLALHVPENIIQISASKDLTVYPFIISSAFIKKMHLETKDIIDLYMSAKALPVFDIQYSDIHILEKYYYLMESILQSNDENKDKIISGIMVSFMYKVHDILKMQKKEWQNKTRTPSRSEVVFEDFIRELNMFNGTEHSLTFFANRLHLTPNYLSGRIKEYSGRTAIEWIEDAVTLEAKALLKHTNMTIQEIAYKLNFPTQTFFSKYFKRITGMSPKQYRNL